MGHSSSHIISQWLFLRLLGSVYFIAFGSLFIQLRGLYGSSGMLPIAEYTAAVKKELGGRAFQYFPSIFLYKSSDAFLTGCAATGIVLAVLLVMGLFPVPSLILLWFLYLSFVLVGQEFLSYQWDALLLETGFMSIFFAMTAVPSLLEMFTYWVFLFRFMFSSGWVKLASGDINWRNLRALVYHYETQPLPNRVAWYLHKLPEPVQRASTFLTLSLELAVPFLALGPASGRLACFFLLLFQQLLIFTSGNYGFFNILTAVLCIPLLDDKYLNVLSDYVPVPAGQGNFMPFIVSVAFVVFLVLNVMQLVLLMYRPRWLLEIIDLFQPIGISSNYGLFAVMTTERFEFVIEGSNDLKEWKPYEFRWKPGDPAKPPRQVAPHQPRLDWQMWFAALNPAYIEPWLQRLVRRLLEGSPSVLSLFKTIPFRESPPTYLRLLVFRYTFSEVGTLKQKGMWWKRTLLGASSVMTLQNENGP